LRPRTATRTCRRRPPEAVCMTGYRGPAERSAGPFSWTAPTERGTGPSGRPGLGGEEGDGSLPGEPGGGGIVALGAGVVMEGVVDIRIDDRLVADMGGLQRGLIGRQCLDQAGVTRRVLDQQPGLDLRHLGEVRR